MRKNPNACEVENFQVNLAVLPTCTFKARQKRKCIRCNNDMKMEQGAK